MKKILLSLILIVMSCVSLSGSVYAAAATPTKVIVTEMIPGADCKCQWATASDGKTCATSVSVEKRKYECEVKPGLAGFQQMLATIIKWFINIVMLCAVLAIVGLGIAWSFAGWDDAKAKTSLKKWWVNIMMGLIILFFFRYILQFLAPWIYK
jgi:hypothetical protein